MKLVVFSDIHDNLARWKEVAEIIATERISIGICCGDVQNIETLEEISQAFKKIYLCFGNADVALKNQTGLIPENIEWGEEILEILIDNKKVAIVHNDHTANELAQTKKYDLVFYGHTHTPWERVQGKTILLNPGEIAGRYGKATFAIFDTESMKATLRIIE